MLGVDVNEVSEVRIKDATFKVGILPYGIRLRINSIALKYAGLSKEKLEKAITENSHEFTEQNLQYVKYGIRGHSGIKTKAGSEIPFKASKERLGDREIPIVSDETLDMYLAMGIVPELSQIVNKENILTTEETKN